MKILSCGEYSLVFHTYDWVHFVGSGFVRARFIGIAAEEDGGMPSMQGAHDLAVAQEGRQDRAE